MVRAPSSPAVSDGYEIWAVESKPVSVHLRSSASGQLRSFASDSSQRENGGILWGRVRDTGENYFIVSVERVERLRCHHDRGEGWVLSDRDRTRLQKRIASAAGDLQPVGFWRTHRRLGLYLDKRDLDLMEQFFPHPWSIALCIRPPATAGFFFWEHGDIHRTSSYREFILPDAVQPVDGPFPFHSRNWRNWAAGLAAAAVVTAPIIFQANYSKPTSPFNMLSMQADAAPGSVRLRWDPQSPVLRDADRGVLWIADGHEESKMELSAEQLRTGSLEYRPANLDVNFRLQVGQFAESLRVTTPAAEAELLPEPAAVLIPTVTEQPKKPARPRAPARQVRSRRMQPPALSPGSSSSQSHDVAVLGPPAIAVTSARLERPPIPQRQLEAPQVTASVESPGSSLLKKTFGWMIPGRKKDFVPAKPLKQVQPSVRRERAASVAVRVSIDRKGVVQEADVLTKNVDRSLALAAEQAAKRWKFEPARADDRPVASNLVVRFRFFEDRQERPRVEN